MSFQTIPSSEPKSDFSSNQPKSDSNREVEMTNSPTAVRRRLRKLLSKTKKSPSPFLTSSQLSDLFCRLDRNGDGELDLDEFTGIIRMCKLDANEDFISAVFRSVDSNNSGSIELQEFICAYQKIYCKHNDVLGAAAAVKQESEFIRVTRYGSDEKGNRVFELYTLSDDPKGPPNTKTVFDFPDRNVKNPELDLEFPEFFDNCKSEPFTGTMDDINKLITADNKRNFDSDSRLMWWVDISMRSVERTKVSKYVDIFGLPNNSKFLSSFGNFGNSLPKDPKSRIFVGNGVTVQGHVASYSTFVQAVTLLDCPVVHHLPSWIENRLVGSHQNSGFLSQLSHYYTTRFAFMFNLSMLSDSRAAENVSAIESAASIAKRFQGDAHCPEEDWAVVDEDEGEGLTTREELTNRAAALFSQIGRSKSTKDFGILQSHGRALPVEPYEHHQSPPTWTLSNSQLIKRPPVVRLDTVSIHVVEHAGRGANCLVTIRKLDDESARFTSLESRSRSGVLGRIFDAVWMKLMHIISTGGLSDVAGELDDSPATLMSFLAGLIHSYSMRSLGTIDSWMSTVEKEVQDMVVSKHSTHLKLLERVIKDIFSYVDPIHELYAKFNADCETETAAKAREVTEAAQQQQQQQQVLENPSAIEKPLRSHAKRRISCVNETSSLDGSEISVMLVTPVTTAVSSDLDVHPISYDLIKRFYNSSVGRDLKIVLDGYELLDTKGLHYWKERLDKYAQRLNEVKDLIGTQLDEKRNFISFTLTIVTTLLAPLAILTGYFGMNFDNMKELDHTYWKAAPGINLMWYITAACYGVMLLGAIHFRTIYSAT